MTKSYFEIGGELIELDVAHPHLSTQSADPSGVSQIAKQQAQPAARNGAGTSAASPRSRTTSSDRTIAYSLGVGRGNPLTWLAASVIIKGAGIIVDTQPELAY